MSASPNNANFRLTNQVRDFGTTQVQTSGRPSGHADEALQALLALASLQQQVRQRRARKDEPPATSEVWGLEHLVLDEVLQLVAERALAITGGGGVAIALAEGSAIVCRASAGVIAPDAGARLDPNFGVFGACLRSEQIVRCDDSEVDPPLNVHACRRLGARSMVAVPLSARQTVVGLLEAFSSEAYGFNDSDVRSLNLLAELILAALRPEEEDRLAEISRRVVAGTIESDGSPQPALSIHGAANFAAPEPANPGVAPKNTNPTPEISATKPTSATIPESAIPESSRPGLLVVLAVVLLAVAIGAVVWWKIDHKTGTVAAKLRSASAVS